MIKVKLNKKILIVIFIIVSFLIKQINYIITQEVCIISIEKNSIKNNAFSEKFISENVNSHNIKKPTWKKIFTKIKIDYNKINIALDEYKFIIYFTNKNSLSKLINISCNFISYIVQIYRAPPQY